MRFIGYVLVIASLAACSSTAQVVKAKHGAQAVAQQTGWLQLQGVPELEAAQLDCQGTATVLEAPDDRGDPLEIIVGASDPARSINVSIIVNKHNDRSRGLQINGVYPLDKIGGPYQVNIQVGDVIYLSRGGTVTLDYAPGTISGTFVAEVARAFDASAPPLHVEGHFDGMLGFACHALPPATPDPDAQGGWGEVEGEPPSQHWVAVGLDHPFCRAYRGSLEPAEAPGRR